MGAAAAHLLPNAKVNLRNDVYRPYCGGFDGYQIKAWP